MEDEGKEGWKGEGCVKEWDSLGTEMHIFSLHIRVSQNFFGGGVIFPI